MNRQVIIMCLFIFCLGIMTGSAFAATMEIMTNPGFETGTDAAAPPWYNQASWGACNGGAITATPEEPANSGARLWKMSGADDGTIDCVEVVSTFGAGGGLFKCSAYVRAPTASPTNPVTAQLRIWFGNAANMYIDGFWGAAVMLTSPDWTLIDDASGGVGLLVSAPCTQVIFRVRVTSTDPAMVAYVDDASILTDRHPVTGRVVDDLGNPMADVKVYIDSNNPPATIVAAAATDDDGTYSATVLDDVELYAKAVPGGLYSESNVVTLPATTEPAVASDLVVTKLATVKFTGRVIDATTKLGIAGAAVAANIADGLGINANSVMAIAGSDGSYELEVLDDSVNPIGTYEYYICAGHSLMTKARLVLPLLRLSSVH
ncbi:MAG: carboxypeptidase-like regulatory domain-containing protein [Armatimonadetes bacterium]|nr:carboxypeptidase-like regulatory domain-containing protein [Armatimonadota bacterium]